MRPHRLALGIVLAAILLWLAVMVIALRALTLPDAAIGTVLVVFSAAVTDAAALSAIVDSGGEPIRQTGLGAAWVAHSVSPGFVGQLRQRGAIAAFPDVPFGPVLAGCAGLVAGDARLTRLLLPPPPG